MYRPCLLLGETLGVDLAGATDLNGAAVFTLVGATTTGAGGLRGMGARVATTTLIIGGVTGLGEIRGLGVGWGLGCAAGAGDKTGRSAGGFTTGNDALAAHLCGTVRALAADREAWIAIDRLQARLQPEEVTSLHAAIAFAATDRLLIALVIAFARGDGDLDHRALGADLATGAGVGLGREPSKNGNQAFSTASLT